MASPRPKRVLVTGASGFIGEHLIGALLRRRYAVVALGRKAPHSDAVEFIACDLLDSGSRRRAVALAGADHLLHLAWMTDPGICWSSPLNLDWAAATLDLARLFAEGGGRRAVLVGSCAEYEWSRDVFSEDAPCRPHTLYGAAKDATRRMVLAFADTIGLEVSWARLFYMYGPGEQRGRLVSDAIAAMLDRQPFPTTQGLQRKDFLHVADVAEALASVLASNLCGPINIASGTTVSVRRILDILAERMDGGACLRFGVLPDRVGEPPVIQADVRRLAEKVGFKPRFDLESGLAETIEAAIRRRS